MAAKRRTIKSSAKTGTLSHSAARSALKAAGQKRAASGKFVTKRPAK